MPYMVYSYGIDNEPSKGDYAIQLNSDIIYDCYEYAIKNECLASKANSAENLFAKNEESNEKVKLDYNAKIKRTYTNDVTLFVIQATKEINPGEEILTQYTMYEDEVFFEGSEDYKNDNKNNNKKLNLPIIIKMRIIKILIWSLMIVLLIYVMMIRRWNRSHRS